MLRQSTEKNLHHRETGAVFASLAAAVSCL